MADDQQAHRVATKLAQLLGETMIHAAPHTSQIDHAEKWRQTEAFLEGLEKHTSGQVGPFLRKLLDGVEIPEFFKPLLEEAIDPPAQFSAVITQVFLYQIVGQIIGTSISPFLQGVLNDIWTLNVSDKNQIPTPMATIANAVGRGLNLGDKPTLPVPDWAYSQAAQQGFNKEDVDLAASLVGLPPAFQELLEMRRRGIINDDELATGLKEGDFRDDWISRAVQLIHSWPTPLDFVRAAVQAQMSYADARDWAQKTGLDVSTGLPLTVAGTEVGADMFGLLFSVAGRPPGPQELARAANRGIIDWDGTGADKTTFQQGIAESDVKTKWTATLKKLAEYVPPPREVGTLLERGAITSDQAVTFWQQAGVPEVLAKGYAYMAEQQHIGQDKLLAKGEVLTAYFDRLISNETATDYLEDLGYRGDIAKQILAVQDFRRDIQAINGVVRRASNLYANHKLTNTAAKEVLTAVGLAPEQADDILGHWEALRSAAVRVPTTAEIGLAVKYGTLTQDEAMTALENLGYEPRDAAIILSAHSGAAVTPLPAAGATITG